MAHLHTRDGEHDLVVSMHIVRLDFDEPKLMLHFHKNLGRYLQFGGHVELDENPWLAVERELAEETGYELSQLELLQPKGHIGAVSGAQLHPQPVCVNTHPITETHSHIGLDYAFITNQDPKHGVGEDESSDFKFVSRSELIEMSDDEVFPGCRDVGIYILDHCLTEWDHVSTMFD